ncbi:glycosyltransferase family 4 protein [Sphingosinicella terrae]|uniref:glycosyltransferase family 4 protein n=1 Tax=Sphingosinicella terrae TaxID=2172047 RepID=UPI000E0DCCB9|nr:glycosyltransferase family 1 protein [Sphingosinicella terrae]
MRVLIVTDAWAPQVNGVVRTLLATRRELERRGHEVAIISPDLFRSVACPTYPEIRLALVGHRSIAGRIAAFAPDSIHIATEGPLGLAARRACLDRGWRFTTAYHTQFPDYVARRTGLPAGWFWRYMKWFHRPSQAILVATPTVAGQLASHGLRQTRPWGRGVDLGGFNPEAAPHPAFQSLPRPIQLYVGRIAVEKNIGAFLATRRPGSKVVVGGGPALERLRRDHPETCFLGPLSGSELASAYASADVFVFPSRTDTFGLVMIEAMACGTPVAAFPVPGPLDVLDAGSGAMDETLDRAIDGALKLDRARCAARARAFSWAESARQFEAALVPLQGAAAAGPVLERLQLRESGIAPLG